MGADVTGAGEISMGGVVNDSSTQAVADPNNLFTEDTGKTWENLLAKTAYGVGARAGDGVVAVDVGNGGASTGECSAKLASSADGMMEDEVSADSPMAEAGFVVVGGVSDATVLDGDDEVLGDAEELGEGGGGGSASAAGGELDVTGAGAGLGDGGANFAVDGGAFLDQVDWDEMFTEFGDAGSD